jgi:membrane dipeptidase
MSKTLVSRRALLAAGAVAAPMLSSGVVQAADGTKYSTRAVDLVNRSMVIDMLAPLWLMADLDRTGFGKPFPKTQLDDWRRSGITAVNHAIGLGGPTAYQDALGWIAGWNGFIARQTDVFIGVGGVADLDLAKATKRIAVIRGVQNADHFRTPADVALFHALGLRVCQLTYNEQNLLGSGSTEREDGGVSDFGAEIIAAMNKVGILVDTGHSGDRTTQDAAEISKKPIAITHSNCRAVANHPRGKSDAAILAVTKKGGVMGISGVRQFVATAEPTTIENMIDHYDYVVKISGIEHVGIGSDADLYGYDALPAEIQKALKANYKASYGFRDKTDIEAFAHPKKIYDLTDALIRRGYTDAHIELILGGNFKRLLAEAWTPLAS